MNRSGACRPGKETGGFGPTCDPRAASCCNNSCSTNLPWKPRSGSFLCLEDSLRTGKTVLNEEDKVNKWNVSSLNEHTAQKLCRSPRTMAARKQLFTPRLQATHYYPRAWVYQAMSLNKQNVAILTPETKGFKISPTSEPKHKFQRLNLYIKLWLPLKTF